MIHRLPTAYGFRTRARTRPYRSPFSVKGFSARGIPQCLDDMPTESIRSLSGLENLGDSAQDTLQGSGQAADGQVSVLVGPDGRPAELNLNPRVMRFKVSCQS